MPSPAPFEMTQLPDRAVIRQAYAVSCAHSHFKTVEYKRATAELYVRYAAVQPEEAIAGLLLDRLDIPETARAALDEKTLEYAGIADVYHDMESRDMADDIVIADIVLVKAAMTFEKIGADLGHDSAIARDVTAVRLDNLRYTAALAAKHSVSADLVAYVQRVQERVSAQFDTFMQQGQDDVLAVLDYKRAPRP